MGWKIEGMALKEMLCLNKQLHNTPIFNALNIEGTSVKLLKDKLNLFVRIIENEMSCKIMTQFRNEFADNSLIGEVAEFLKLDHRDNLDEIRVACVREINRQTNNAIATRK